MEFKFWNKFLCFREETERRKMKFETEDNDEEEEEEMEDEEEEEDGDEEEEEEEEDEEGEFGNTSFKIIFIFIINRFIGTSWKENISKKFSISYVPSKTINWTKLVYGKTFKYSQ